MTRKELFALRWKANMVVIYKPPRIEIGIECSLIGINWDEEIMILMPLDIKYKNEDLYVNSKYVELPPKEMKVILEKNK